MITPITEEQQKLITRAQAQRIQFKFRSLVRSGAKLTLTLLFFSAIISLILKLIAIAILRLDDYLNIFDMEKLCSDKKLSQSTCQGIILGPIIIVLPLLVFFAMLTPFIRIALAMHAEYFGISNITNNEWMLVDDTPVGYDITRYDRDRRMTVNDGEHIYSKLYILICKALKSDDITTVIDNMTYKLSSNSKINILNTPSTNNIKLRSIVTDFNARKNSKLLDSIDKDLQQLRPYLIPLLQQYFEKDNKTGFARLNKDLLVNILSYLYGENSRNYIEQLLTGNFTILSRIVTIVDQVAGDRALRPMDNNQIQILNGYKKNIVNKGIEHTNTLLQPQNKLMLWFANREQAKAAPEPMRGVTATGTHKKLLIE